MTNSIEALASQPHPFASSTHHPIWGLGYRLLVDGLPYSYNAWLDAWEGPEFCDPLTGSEIHRRVAESPVRLGVQR